MSESKRYGTLDFIRGVNLISMILYHACWDLNYLFNVIITGYAGVAGRLWQKSICYTFILLSGICSSIGKDSKRKIKRGFLIIVLGEIVSIVTFLVMPEDPIHFGILTFMGFAMILFGLFDKPLRKQVPVEALIFCLILFYMTKEFAKRRFNLFLTRPIMPTSLYANMFTAFLGFPPVNFTSTDYFPVFPWIFLYGAGYYIGLILDKLKILCKLKYPSKGIFNYIGKHTLFIYMLHQPVIYGILYLFLHK